MTPFTTAGDERTGSPICSQQLREFVATNLNFSDREATRDKLLTLDQVERIVRSGRLLTIVLSPYDQILFPKPWTQIVEDAGYRAVATAGDRTIYQPQSP
jgi:hypothetical protein